MGVDWLGVRGYSVFKKVIDIYHVVRSLFLIEMCLNASDNINQRYAYCLNRPELVLMPKIRQMPKAKCRE